MNARTNVEWLTALKSADEAQTAALSDLRAYLLRVALYALYRRRNTLPHLAPADIDHLAQDCAQDALSSIVKHLDQFRGESRFTTWAYNFAVNAVLVAARREQWSRVRLDRLLESPELLERIGSARASSDPHRRALQREVLAVIREGIDAHLTPRQRQALIAVVFEAVPLDELARHWASNRNAVYKLVHDARKKLKAHLHERGFEAEDVRDVFDDEP